MRIKEKKHHLYMIYRELVLEHDSTHISKKFKTIFLFKIIFLVFLNYFDVLILKIIF
jgi:hypothetical protein